MDDVARVAAYAEMMKRCGIAKLNADVRHDQSGLLQFTIELSPFALAPKAIAKDMEQAVDPAADEFDQWAAGVVPVDLKAVRSKL